MMIFKNDKRSLRTRSLIKQAVIKLLKSKLPEDITVSEVTKLADVSRNSFYTHYKNVSNVLYDVYSDIIARIDGIIANYSYEEFILNPYPMLYEFTRPFTENTTFTEYIVFSKNSSMFIQGFIDALTERFLAVYYKERGNNNPAMPYLINFLISGVIGFIYKWFRDNKPVPFEDVMRQASILIKQTVVTIRDVKKEI
ncbi:MAG: TetR/AcrR family transcriptional regulator [Clostridia bacterium]|nr:TetR/AcrR family transcriptional regulator [Clostridia bacterium]